MKKLLVINFLITLLALKNIFNWIYGKYGQTTRNLARNTERTRIKIKKLKCDIKFLLTCKRNKLVPTFAKPKIAIRIKREVRRRIANTIIEAELVNKHNKLKELNKVDKQNVFKLRNTVGFVTF